MPLPTRAEAWALVCEWVQADSAVGHASGVTTPAAAEAASLGQRRPARRPDLRDLKHS